MTSERSNSNNSKKSDDYQSSLRQRAEDFLKSANNQEQSAELIETTQDLIQELQIYQIELELQNQELRSVQDQLQKSQREYFQLFNNAPIAYLIIDEKGIIQNINLRGLDLLNQQRRYIIGRSFLTYCHHSSHQAWVDTLETIFNFQIMSNHTLRLLPREKQNVVVYADANGEYFEEDGQRYCRLTLTDVTLRIIAQQATRKRERELQQIVMESPIPIMVCKASGQIVVLSRSWVEMTGYTQRELKSYSDWAYYGYRQENTLQSWWIKQLFNDGQRKDLGHHTIYSRFGQEMIWHMFVSPLTVHHKDDVQDETDQHLLFMGTPIHQPKQSDSSFAQSVPIDDAISTLSKASSNESVPQMTIDHLQSAFDALRDEITILDETGTIVMVNKAWKRFAINYGANTKTTHGIGMNYVEISRYEDENRVADLIERILHGEQEHAELTYTLPLNDEHTLQFQEQILGFWYNNSRFAIVLHRDITSQHLIESELAQSLEREQEINLLRKRFMTMLSHELRTPLAAVLASADMLAKYDDKLSPARKKHHTNTILRQAAVLTNSLDDLSFINSGDNENFELEPTSDNLYQIISDLLENIVPLSEYAGQITVQTDEPNRTAQYDKSLTNKVFRNLLLNAMKFSPDNTPILVKIVYDKNDIRITVTDHGIGIPINDQQYLFQELFHRGSNVQNIKGTGVGHMIIKAALDAYGGQIHLSSRVGVGTTFIVNIPYL